MRKLRNGVLVLMLLTALTALGAAPASASSGFSFPFTSSAEGWTSTQGELAPTTANWTASEHAISITDTNANAYNGFFSPHALEGGDYGANLGGTLSMEIKSSKTWTEEPVILVVGSANSEEALCVLEEGVFPTTSYHKFQYKLDGVDTLVLNSEGTECNEQPTELEVSEVLSTFLGVTIPGEDEASSGETTTIDNITLSGGAPLPFHTLTALRVGTGSGTVTSSPAGIACGATCAKGFPAGAKVTLTATPAAGSTFTGWSGGGCTGTAPCQVTLSADREVTAIFEKTPAAGGGGGGGSTLPPAKKPLKCKKGFKKKTVHGKARCVKVKKKKHHH